MPGCPCIQYVFLLPFFCFQKSNFYINPLLLTLDILLSHWHPPTLPGGVNTSFLKNDMKHRPVSLDNMLCICIFKYSVLCTNLSVLNGVTVSVSSLGENANSTQTWIRTYNLSASSSRCTTTAPTYIILLSAEKCAHFSVHIFCIHPTLCKKIQTSLKLYFSKPCLWFPVAEHGCEPSQHWVQLPDHGVRQVHLCQREGGGAEPGGDCRHVRPHQPNQEAHLCRQCHHESCQQSHRSERYVRRVKREGGQPHFLATVNDSVWT